jgi:predicted DNA-binding transcriptional regulator AlpA
MTGRIFFLFSPTTSQSPEFDSQGRLELDNRIFRMTAIKQLDAQPDLKCLTKAEVIGLTGISKDTLDRMVSQGEGPPCVRLSPRRLGFPVAGLRAWLQSRRINTGDAA